MNAPTRHSPRIAALLEKARAAPRGRLLFSIDGTASREPMWDMATTLTAGMFTEAARLGGINVQLCHFGGDEFHHSSWCPDAHEVVNLMRTIRCKSGATQIAKVLRHIWIENQRQKVDAAVFIGDACEERPGELYDVAMGLAVPMFMFQEGDSLAIYLDEHGEIVNEHPPMKVERVFREIAEITGGAYGKFDAGAAGRLGEMLRAVAAFASGGIKALTNQNTDSARLLLAQMK
jgi:hypothetical protein